MKKKLFIISFLIFLIAFKNECKSQTIIHLTKDEGGVYTIPCTVNGLPLRFIFDTGASDVSISLTEAAFMLKNGYLNKEDFFEDVNYQTASGEILAGSRIILHEIKFSGLILRNVQASVVHELNAPLLLGQSALIQLGKFQMDPVAQTLTILPNTQNYYQNIYGIKLGHINSSDLLKLMPEVIDADYDLQIYQKNLENTNESMTKEYSSKLAYYQKNGTTMKEVVRQVKEQELGDLEQRIQKFQAEAQDKFAAKKDELYSPILKKAEDAIKSVAKEYGYSYVFDTSVGAVIFAQDSDNIMDLVKMKLGLK